MVRFYHFFIVLNTASKSNVLKIKKAILFPFNKEMHSLVNFCEIVNFEIVDVFETKFSGRVGKNISNLLSTRFFKIKNIEECDWDDFDTLILGHVSEYSNLLKYDMKKSIIEKCLNNRKNVFAFDYEFIDRYKTLFLNCHRWIESPSVAEKFLISNKGGKLYEISSPVFGVLGTSRHQGKFTLQLSIYSELKRRGYDVGFLGTEPNSALFGADLTYPFGYEANIVQDAENCIETVNSMMHEICKNEPDLIMVGNQSGTLPISFDNLSYMLIKQQMFLLGTLPDAVVLCVNVFEDILYVERTISYIESLTAASVIGICIYPFEVNLMKRLTRLDNKIIQNKKKELETTFGIPTYINGEAQDINSLCDNIVRHFSED